MTTQKKTEKEKTRKRYYVRLRRYGPQDEFGLASFYLGGKLYKRTRVYTVDARTRAKLKATGKFEDIMPEDLEEKREATERGASRGVSVGVRARVKRREAVQRRRPSAALADGPDDFADSGDGYEPGDADPFDVSEDDSDGEDSVSV